MAARMPAVMSDNGAPHFTGGPSGPLAGETHDAAHGLRDQIETATVLVGAGAAEARQRAVDQRRMRLAQLLITEAKPLHDAGREIFHQHVGGLRSGARSTFAPPGFFRSSAMPRLLRFIIRNDAVSSPILGGRVAGVVALPESFRS